MNLLALALSSVLPFIGIPHDPVTLATASAGSASRAQAVYRNSAAVPFMDAESLASFSYQSWAPSEGASDNYILGGAIKFTDRFSVNVSEFYQSGSRYDLYDASGTPSGAFTPRCDLLTVGAAYAFGEKLSVGLGVGYAWESDAPQMKLSALTADLHLFYLPAPSLDLAFSLLSLGPGIKAADGSLHGLPSSARLGASYGIPLGTVGVRLLADADWFFESAFGISAGAELKVKDCVSLRGGYHYSDDPAPLPAFASLGAGFQFKSICVDLAWLTASKTLNNTIVVGISLHFK